MPYRRSLLCGLQSFADDRHPLAHAPRFDETVDNVGVPLSECLGELRRRTSENQHGAVYRVRQCAGQNQLSALERPHGVFHVQFAERCPLLDITFHDFVKEEVMHRWHLQLLLRVEPRCPLSL